MSISVDVLQKQYLCIMINATSEGKTSMVTMVTLFQRAYLGQTHLLEVQTEYMGLVLKVFSNEYKRKYTKGCAENNQNKPSKGCKCTLICLKGL